MCASCSRNVLILRNGGENPCSTLVKDYIGRHADFEERLIDNYSFEERKQACEKKRRVVLLCRVQERLELYQDEMVSKLSRYLQKNLVVIYIVSKGSLNPYFVTNASELTTQINVSLENLDEKFIKNTLKESFNITSDPKRSKNKFILLLFGTILAVLYLISRSPQGPADVQNQFTLSELYEEIDVLRAYIGDLELQQTVLQKDITILKADIIENQKKIEELEPLIKSRKDYQLGFILLLILNLLFQIFEIRLLPFAKTFFKKGKCLFKKAEENEKCLTDSAENIKNDSSENQTNSLNDNFSTGSSDQAVESGEAEKATLNGSIGSSIPAATEGSLVRTEAFCDEKEGFVLLNEGQK